MSQIEENKQIDETLENTNFDYTYSPMGELQGLLLDEMFDVVSTPADDAMGTSRMAPQDGRCGELRAPGLDLCQKSSPFPPK